MSPLKNKFLNKENNINKIFQRQLLFVYLITNINLYIINKTENGHRCVYVCRDVQAFRERGKIIGFKSF